MNCPHFRSKNPKSNDVAAKNQCQFRFMVYQAGQVLCTCRDKRGPNCTENKMQMQSADAQWLSLLNPRKKDVT